MWQTLIAYLLVALAALWLVRHLFWPAAAGSDAGAGCASGGCSQCDGCPSSPVSANGAQARLVRIPVRQQ